MKREDDNPEPALFYSPETTGSNAHTPSTVNTMARSDRRGFVAHLAACHRRATIRPVFRRACFAFLLPCDKRLDYGPFVFARQRESSESRV
jgi:hypothetical protein